MPSVKVPVPVHTTSPYTFPVVTCYCLYCIYSQPLACPHHTLLQSPSLQKTSAMSRPMRQLPSFQGFPIKSEKVLCKALQALATPSSASPRRLLPLPQPLVFCFCPCFLVFSRRQKVSWLQLHQPTRMTPPLGSGYGLCLGSNIISSENPSKVKDLLV